ncbi:MAG: flagellar hook capping FlgD N-terminal domain-containing protein [Luminiphilus sp.]|nr:flagellar hook capping FlgD N-terminal domain-containing protein [Luminiphilus sp.]
MAGIDSILTTDQYQTQQANAMFKNGDDDDMLGRDAFLQLFTAQLKNQNPLDPMENEAFVAQLAQFSSVEGIKGMQSSLETLVGNLREQSLLTGSELVGKRVAIAGGFGQGGGAKPTQTLVSLQDGADMLTMSVYNDSGELVFRQNVGELEPGEHRFAWSGQDSNGNQLPVDTYQVTASAIVDGRMQIAPVSILETVSSVSWNPAGQQLDLQLLGGNTVSLAEIQTIAE